MSIDHSRTATSTGISDAFLNAVSTNAVSLNAVSSQPTRDKPGQETADGSGARGAGVAGPIAIALFIVALLAALVALVDGARRADTTNLASTLAESPGSVSMPVQSPFVDTTVRMVENQSAALWQQDDGSPAIRLASTETAAVAALVNEDGIPVALGVLPQGLEGTPERMLISPVSTALTIAAMHPDVLSGTASDSFGRLAVAARSGAFGSLAGLVNGTTPVASLGPESISAVNALAASLTAATSALEPTCVAAEVPAPGIVRCGDTSELQNTGLRAVPVIDASGELCGLVPPAVFAASPAEHAAVVAMIADGLPFDTAAALGAVTPGRFDPAATCGGSAEIPTQADATKIAQWRGQTELVDVALPLARMLGVDATAQSLPNVQAAAAPSDAPADRLTNAMDTIAEAEVNSGLGLNRQAQATDIVLDGLVQSTIARLYE